jgi:hypothetical protein
VCCGGGNLNLEEKRRENETWIKVRVLGKFWHLFGWTNFKIMKILDDRGKISDLASKRDISEILDFIGQYFFPFLVHFETKAYLRIIGIKCAQSAATSIFASINRYQQPILP